MGNKMATEYTSLFKQYADRTDLSAANRLIRYRSHLSSLIKDRLAASDWVVDTFEQLEKAVLEINVWHRERQAEKAQEQGRSAPSHPRPAMHVAPAQVSPF